MRMMELHSAFRFNLRIVTSRLMVTRRPPLYVCFVLLVSVYVIAGKFGLSVAFFHASASAVWPPAGIALASLILWGIALWPAVFIGAFLVHFTTAGSFAVTLPVGAGPPAVVPPGAVVGGGPLGRDGGRRRHQLILRRNPVRHGISRHPAAFMGRVSLRPARRRHAGLRHVGAGSRGHAAAGRSVRHVESEFLAHPAAAFHRRYRHDDAGTRGGCLGAQGGRGGVARGPR